MKRFFCALLSVMTLMMSFAGCSRQSGTSGQEIVLNEVAHSVFYAPLYVAIEEGYFEKNGINLKLETGFGADKTMTAVLTGAADIGFMGSESSVYTYLGGVEDYAVNFAQLTQRAGNFLVARTEENDFSFEKLRGKTVLGGRTGGMPEMVFEYILHKNDMDVTDMNIVQNIDFGSTAAAFSGGQGDYTIEFEPHATALENKGDGYVVASLGEASGYVPYTAFCAKKSYMENNREVLTAFVKAVQEGCEYVQNHTAEETAACIAPQFPETEEKELAEMIARYAKQHSWKNDLVFEKDAFELLQNILLDAKVIEERAPYEKLVDTSLIPGEE